MSDQGYQPQPLRNAVAGYVGGGTPSRQVPSYWRGQIPWASVKDFPEQSGVIDDTEEHISTSGLNASASNLISAGTPLVCTRMAVGRAAMPSVPMAINQDVKAIFPAQGVSPAYLLKLLQFIQPRAEAQAVGSTVKGIRIQDYLDIKAPIADADAQSIIAQVLDTLDTAIHETEAIIAKLKAVKQGLLHDLLTRGIDANGELRPLLAEAPHLYKESPLGWIPKEWDAHVFGDTIEHVIDFRGRTPRKLGMDWGGGDILALSANNVQPGGIDVSREAYFGGERLYSKWMTSGDVRKGDVLLTMEAPLGNVAQIPDDARYILSQRVIALRFKPSMVLNDFAFWQMQSTEFQRAMIKRSTGSTATGIQRAELVKLHFKAPPVDEQSWIAQRLFSVEQKLASELVALEKQKQEKSGLMDDLLTGRVRVTPLLDKTEQQGSA